MNSRIVLIIFFLLSPVFGRTQGSIDQEAIRALVEDQRGSVNGVTKVNWHVLTIQSEKHKDTLIRLLTTSVAHSRGTYDSLKRIQIVELANRMRLDYIKSRKQLIVPDVYYNDYRSYSPWPLSYQPATTIPKLFIIDKYTQTFGAYEYGQLVHWGIISAGRSNSSTPAGRYNFNWKTYYKLSNAAPPGVKWHLYWVFDFYAKIGLHVHQYSLPIGTPASHGCVRTSLPDAQWNYTWSNGWVKDSKGKLIRNGTPVMVINNNPPHNKALHWQILPDGSVISLVVPPASITNVPLGSFEQHKANWLSGW